MYTLETANGRLPGFSDRAKVFFMVKASPNLLADSEAKSIAEKFDFTSEPNILDEKTYRWTRTQSELISTFEMEITQKHFSLSSDFLSRPNLILEQELPTNFDAVKSVKGYLQTANKDGRS